MSTPPAPISSAPSWPHCAQGADPGSDPVGCRGIHVPGHAACLAHLTDTDRDAYLAGLTPGSDIDHRGTPFTEDLLGRLLSALRDPTTARPHIGAARFGWARFSGAALTPDPEDVAALYRQLRKAFEDGKNEPGAADFYYGECEMRRHDRTGTPKGERRLLWGYWLLSGYGLRASRATGWLLAAMSLTVLLLMGFGLPTHDPDPATTGTLHGHRISLTTSAPDPALHGGWHQRMTWARAEKATRVAVNSVVFRSSGQNLTTADTYIEMTSRLLEPTLLALAALAVRGRIKR